MRNSLENFANSGIYDVLALLVNAVGSGYFYLVGGVFCLYPDLQYIMGSFGFGMWCGASMTCLILVSNRILDLWKPCIGDYVQITLCSKQSFSCSVAIALG